MDYIHMAATRLFVQMKITNADGSNLAPNAEVSTVNLPANSLWKSIEVEIGGTPAPELGNVHSHVKAYFETVFSYSGPAIESHLKASLFEMDTAGKFENFNPEIVERDAIQFTIPGVGTAPPNQITVPRRAGHKPNYAYQNRKRAFAESASVQMLAPVHVDLIQVCMLPVPHSQSVLKHDYNFSFNSRTSSSHQA
jgi:hypothetical protein